MDKLKFVLFAIIVLTLFGLGGYWAVVTIQSGSEHVNSKILKKLENENEELKKEMEGLKNNLSILQSDIKDEKPAEQLEKEPEPEKPKVSEKPAPATVYKNQGLINELQKLISDNIVLKLKSSGTRVGTVQKFFNIYNQTSNRVDNDYGASTKSAVSAFQKIQSLPDNGEAGKTTFNKMIDWLKKQG